MAITRRRKPTERARPKNLTTAIEFKRTKLSRGKVKKTNPLERGIDFKGPKISSTKLEKKKEKQKETTEKRLPQKTASKKKREKVTALEKPKVSGIEKLVKIGGETGGLKKQKGSEAPKKEMSKQDRRRSLRAADLAVRKGISLDEAKELQGQRRAGRKQFLKNFAANLAGVEMNKGEFNTKDYENYKKNNAENAETNIVSDQQKSNNIETKSNAQKYKSLFEAMAATPNSSLGNMSYLDDLEV